MGALSEFVKARFGVMTRYNDNPLATSVGTTAAQIWRTNADRLMLVIVNLSSNVMYINVDNAVSSTNGWRVGANGGAVVFTAEEDGELVGYPFWVIAAGAGSSLFSAEVEAV